MAKFTIKDNTNGLAERHLEFIKEVLVKRGYKEAEVTITNVGEAGDNFIANIKRITVENNGETFKMVAKVAPSIEQVRAKLNIGVLFSNEDIMFNEVMPSFAQLEFELGLPDNERFRYPMCYGSLMEEPYEMFLLEDLNVKEYTILNRFKPLSSDAIKLTLMSLAKYHALSFVLKTRDPEKFSSIKSRLTDILVTFDNTNGFELYTQSIENNYLELLADDKYKKAVKGSVTNMFRVSEELFKADKESDHVVIAHGDCWTNNIMYKLENGVPIDCCMIDYQLSRPNLPVADVHHFIFSCSTYEMRHKHYFEWLDYYHDQFNEYLSKFGLEANSVYPKDQFMLDMKRYAKFGFGYALFALSFILRDKDLADDTKEAMETNQSFKDLMQNFNPVPKNEDIRSMIKSRIEELVDSCIELEYI